MFEGVSNHSPSLFCSATTKPIVAKGIFSNNNIHFQELGWALYSLDIRGPYRLFALSHTRRRKVEAEKAGFAPIGNAYELHYSRAVRPNSLSIKASGLLTGRITEHWRQLFGSRRPYHGEVSLDLIPIGLFLECCSHVLSCVTQGFSDDVFDRQ